MQYLVAFTEINKNLRVFTLFKILSNQFQLFVYLVWLLSNKSNIKTTFKTNK